MATKNKVTDIFSAAAAITALASPVREGARRGIVTLDGGWDIIGDVAMEGEDRVIYDAYALRRWGTEFGLGEIACGGLQKDTIAEYVGDVEAPTHATIHIIWSDLKPFPAINQALTTPPEGYTNKLHTLVGSWNLIGPTRTMPNGDLEMVDAAVLRRWGTKHGLGEIVCKGYQSETVAEYVGAVLIPKRALLHSIRIKS